MSKAQASMRRLLSALIVATFVLSSFLSMRAPALAVGGQVGSLSGNIVGDQHEPIADAAVTAASPSGSYHARTDAKGFFSLLGLPADTYTVSIEKPGYQAQTITGVTILGDGSQTINTVTLSRRVIGRVSARAANSAFQPSQTIDQTTLSGARISQALGSATSSNEEQLLLAAPGVQEDSSGNITIRGSQGTEIGYQFDGVNFTAPFFDENGGAGMYQSGGYLNGFASGTGGSIQVISGSGDATQGNIGAGAVNIVPPRGTYPAGGLLSYTFGSPYRQNQYDFDYGIATRNGSISNYLAYDIDNYVPQYAPYGSPASQQTLNGTYGQFSGPSAIRHQDFLDNLIFRFGKNEDQSLQILYRSMYEDDYGAYGGFAGNPFYTNNALALGNFQGLGSFGVGTSQIPPLPGVPTGATTPNQPPLTSQTLTNFLKVGYTKTLGSSTFLTADYYNWYNTQNTYQIDNGAAQPLYQSVGGQRVGFDLDITHQFGSSHTVTIATRYENSWPRWYADEPAYGFDVLNDLEGAPLNYPSLGDFATPTNGAVGGPCPAPGPNGCYIFDHDGGVTVPVPAFGIDYHGTVIEDWGVGIRDQWTISSKLKLDYGLREDAANYKIGTNVYQTPSLESSNPSDIGADLLSAKFLQPHIVQPRFAFVYDIDRDDAIRASYGRSVEFAYGQTFGTPMSLTDVSPLLNGIAPIGGAAGQAAQPTCGSGYNHEPQAPGAKAGAGGAISSYGGNLPVYYFPCTSYAQQLFWAYDQLFDAPDYGGTAQETFSNYDFQYSHQFSSGFFQGWALKATTWWRRGFNIYEDVLLANGPPNPATGEASSSTFNVKPNGIEKAFGEEFGITTPDRPYGWSGYLTANYLSEFTTVPPASNGGAYISDSLPGLVPADLLNSGTVFRTNTLPPFNLDMGVSYKTKSGFKITPIFMATTGYPIGVGSETFTNVNGVLTEVPSTNFGSAGPIGGVVGPGDAFNAPAYVDPALPGSYTHPNIAATRGYDEPALAGGKLSNPTDTLNLDFEYAFGDGQRNTAGIYIGNVLANHYGIPFDNNLWQPVATGVGGPKTGTQNTTSNAASTFYQYYLEGVANYQGYDGGSTYPFISPYGPGLTFTFYVQRKF
jgi:hypothetical protein